MDKLDLVKRATALLRANGVRKPVSIPKEHFYISDDEGNTSKFSAKRIDKSVLLIEKDVAAVVDACLHVIKECIREGDKLTLRGFGALYLKYLKTRKFHSVYGGDIVTPGHYVIRFYAGKDLKRCVELYEESIKDMEARGEINIPDDDTFDDDSYEEWSDD